MERYTTILFDIDDTLVDFKKSEKIGLEYCHTCFFQNLVDIETFEKEYAKINRALWQEVEQGTMTIPLLRKERFRKVCETFKMVPNEAIAQNYEEQLIEHSEWLDGAVEVLEELKQRRFKIGFLTNGFSYIQRKKYKKLEMDRYSDVIVISEEVGTSKPHPTIFRYTLDQIGSQAEETLMVGDSLESDGKGAKQAGIDFCWCTPNPVIDWRPTFLISCIKELGKVIRENRVGASRGML